MKRSNLPTKDQIVRYVKPSMIREDGTTDGSDFRLRPTRPDETGLSVNWLEAFKLDKPHQLEEVRRLSRMDLRLNGHFAELNVGTTIHKVTKELKALWIIHDPLEEAFAL